MLSGQESNPLPPEYEVLIASSVIMWVRTVSVHPVIKIWPFKKDKNLLY
jgi:hypothetical protein